MIRRTRYVFAIPESLQTDACRNNLLSIIDDVSTNEPERITRAKKRISGRYYRGYAKDENNEDYQDVVACLKSIYGCKCAFCESKRFNPDVEHFRPKGEVVEDQEHQGYYWLAYEWTNLLPSCYDCNKAKENYFPLLIPENRVYGPIYRTDRSLNSDTLYFLNSPLIDESPMLFHPEFDENIEESFTFENSGKMHGIDNAGRGVETIRICGLNGPQLRFLREQVIDNIVEKFEIAICAGDNNAFMQLLNKLRLRANDLDAEYTLMHRYIYNNFENMIISLFPYPVQHIAIEIYQEHRLEANIL